MKGTNPRFGIIMSSYNKGQYIAHAISSVLQQTLNDWELVIVDDASTDNSVEVIDPFLKDRRIRLVKHEANKGMGVASKTGADNLTGTILGLLDADDALRPDALEVMNHEYCRHPGYGMIYSQHFSCDPQLIPKNDVYPSARIPLGKCFLEVLESNWSVPVGPFRTFTREAYEMTSGFGSWRGSQDVDITLKLEEVTDLLFVDERLYFYRMLLRSMAADRGGPNFMPDIAREAKERRLRASATMNNKMLRSGADHE